MDIQKTDLIEGMAKGMAVLESFDTERQRLNATLAAQRAGLTRAAARRHLLTLAHLGYLDTDGSYFWLAAKVLRFSGSYLASAQLPRVLQPTLNRLAAQTLESFSAVVRDGAEVGGTQWQRPQWWAFACVGLWPAPGCTFAGARDVYRACIAGGRNQVQLQCLDEGAQLGAADSAHHYRP